MKNEDRHNGRKHSRRRIRIVRPPAQSHEDPSTWREIRRYARLIPYEPEPNLSRVEEIKEEIAKGTYLTPEVMEETVARLAIRFMRRD